MIYYIYILECTNNAYYTGYTTDMERRYQEHVNGSSKCKYTRSFPPRTIVACWKLSLELSHTLKIERLIKALSKNEKHRIILEPSLLLAILKKQGYDQEILDKIQYYPIQT